jgi:chloramphenicol 3-O phosphotransferase
MSSLGRHLSYGRLVVLNGTSSSGKTTTATALAPLLGPGCIVTGLDDILEREQPFGSPPRTLRDRLGRTVRAAAFQRNDGRLRLFQTLHREVAAQVRAGHDVIVDTALMDPRALRDAAHEFAPLNGLFVGMKPPLAVSERWEAAREDRPIGQARRHYDLVHAHGAYDLLLDPSMLTPEACAAAILRRLETGPEPTAFRALLAAEGMPGAAERSLRSEIWDGITERRRSDGSPPRRCGR